MNFSEDFELLIKYLYDECDISWDRTGGQIIDLNFPSFEDTKSYFDYEYYDIKVTKKDYNKAIKLLTDALNNCEFWYCYNEDTRYLDLDSMFGSSFPEDENNKISTEEYWATIESYDARDDIEVYLINDGSNPITHAVADFTFENIFRFDELQKEAGKVEKEMADYFKKAIEESKIVLEDVDRELTLDEKIKKITSEFEPKAVEYNSSDDGWSVKVQDQKSGMEFWVDVWVDTNYKDVETEWNQYIFDIQDDDDQLRSAIQDNNNVWDLASSEAINYLQENNEIKQNEKGEWEVVYKTPDSEYYEIYDSNFEEDTGDISGAGRVWDDKLGTEQEFTFSFTPGEPSSPIYFVDFATGNECEIKNQDLINEIYSLVDDYKDEIEHFRTFAIDESKKLEGANQDYKVVKVDGMTDAWKVVKYKNKYYQLSNSEFNRFKKDPDDFLANIMIDSYRTLKGLIDASQNDSILKSVTYKESKKIEEAKQDKYDYQGYTFIPVGNMKSNLNSFDMIRKNTKLDKIFNVDNGSYNYGEFYKVMPPVDIFKIPELDNILVMPGSNFLFEYSGDENTVTPMNELQSEEELRKPDEQGLIGTLEDKEVVGDLLDDEKDYSDIASKYGYSFNDYQLYNIATLYITSFTSDAVKQKIEDVLEDINYHSECAEIMKDAKKFKDSLFESKKVKTEDKQTTYKELNELNASNFVELKDALEELYDNEVIDDDQFDEFMSIAEKKEEECENYLTRRSKVTNTDEKDELYIESDYVVSALQEIIQCVELNESNKKTLTWDEIFKNAEGTTFGQKAAKVKDQARAEVEELMQKDGIDVDSLESVEDAIEEYVSKHNIKFLDNGCIANKKTEDVAINNGFNVTKYPEVQSLADDIANSIKDKDKVTIDTVINAIENWDGGDTSVFTVLAKVDKDLADKIDADEDNRYEAENQFLGLVEDILNDMGITVYDEYDESKKVEGNKIPRNWKKITYKAKVDTNLNNAGDTIEVERDEWNRPIMKNLRTGKTGQTFIDNLRNDDLTEIIDIKTEDATQCGAVDGGRVSIFGEKEKKEEDNEYFSYVASRNVKETLNDLLSGNYDIMYDYNVENFVDDLIDYLNTLDDNKAHRIAWELNQACISAERSNRRASGTKPRKLIQALKSAKAFLDNNVEKKTESKELSKVEKLKLMDDAARSINDEEIIDLWLMCGIPDGASELDFEEIAEDEESYREIEAEFKKVMKLAVKDGLYQCPPQAFEFAKTYEPNLENID